MQPGIEEDKLVKLIPEKSELPYVLLRPGTHPPRSGVSFQQMLLWKDLPDVLSSIRNSRIVALDLETRGADYSSDIQIIGLGLAWETGSCYLQWSDLSEFNQHRVLDTVYQHPGIIAHNVYFDGGVLRKLFGGHPSWHACTYALLALTANESPERRWGLKNTMTELLGWPDSNEIELDQWLVMYGFYRGNRRTSDDVNYLLSEYSLGKLKPDKREMWRAPADILGKYCVLDAEACYLLYTEILEPILLKFPGLGEYLRTHMHLVELLIDQHIHGISMDVRGLQERREVLKKQIEELNSRFMNHEQAQSHIRDMEHIMCNEIREKEPAKLKKNGQVSKNWINWAERLKKAEQGELEEFVYNINSGPQIRELLYGRLGYPVKITSEKGEPSTSLKAMSGFGGLGKILTERAYAVKELSYIEKYIDLTTSRDSIHPSFRTPGTITGRLSSKEPNMQQIPKSTAVMSLFRARPGKVWIDLDFSALEPVVATEFSQDRNMLRIYGDRAPQNDIYLFVAANVPGEIGKKIRATGYDPDNPTRDALARAKKDCKHERGICKTVVLACQYGAGVKKVMQTLEEQEIYLDYEEVESIHSGYWSLFSGLKQFARDLHVQWRDNQGYILNGLGRPMCVPEEYSKDVLNRFIQSTGHDILVRYIGILSRLLDESGIDWSPLIIDFHDASAIEVGERDLDKAIDCYEQALVVLNTELAGTIRLKGTPSYGTTLADIKEPEE